MHPRFLFLLALLPILAQGQQKNFSISGRSDFYNHRKLGVMVGVYPVYYNDCSYALRPGDSLPNPNPIVEVVDTRFARAGTLRYPHPLCVFYFDAEKKSAPNSYYYFIEGGPVQIEVNDLETHKALRHNLHSAADREYRRLRKYYSSVVDTVTGAVPDLPAKQRLMKSYIAAHPDSYVALWDLVLDVSQARTDDDKRCLMANTALFSAAVKRSNTWRALAHDLEKELTLVVGKVFPELPVQPALSMATTTAMHRYTLVEFWYSHCRPCLEQAPAWKEVYKQVKDKGVAFLGISVDKEEHRGDWRKAIETVGMDWPQFLDVNGVEADRINVRVFPSNFLLDEKGIILKKDITPQELQAFLEAKAGQ